MGNGEGKLLEAVASAEAQIVTWSDWESPNGQRWSVTMRSGATGETMAAFAAELGIAETLLIGAGWEPTDRKGPLGWPPADKEAARKAEIQALAAKMAVENAEKALEPTLLALAKKALADAAVAAGVMRSEKDGERAAAIKEAAKAAGLGEFAPEHLAEWVKVVVDMALEREREGLAAELKKAADAKGAAPVAKAPPKVPVQKPPAPKAEGNGAETKSEAGGTIRFSTVAIAAKKDGSAVVEFWAGRKYPEITWSLGAEKLLEQAPNMAETFDVDTLSAIGSTYAVAGTVQWEASEKLNAKGVPYKNLMNVVLG